MFHTFRRRFGVALLISLLLTGCGGAPSRPKPPAPPTPLTRTPQDWALNQALNEFYGAPYRSGGTTPAGVDCSGLIQAVFQRAGVGAPRTVAQQYGYGRPVNAGQLRFGDVVFFNRYCQIRGPKRDYFFAGILPPAYAQEVCHNGIYLGEGRFVHASPKGVFVSRLDAEVWRQSFMGARRFMAD